MQELGGNLGGGNLGTIPFRGIRAIERDPYFFSETKKGKKVRLQALFEDRTCIIRLLTAAIKEVVENAQKDSSIEGYVQSPAETAATLQNPNFQDKKVVDLMVEYIATEAMLVLEQKKGYEQLLALVQDDEEKIMFLLRGLIFEIMSRGRKITSKGRGESLYKLAGIE